MGDVVDKCKVVLSPPITGAIIITSFRMKILDIVLGESAKFAVYLCGETLGKPFHDYKEIVVDGTQYLGWGANDEYIKNVVQQKIHDMYLV